MIISIDFDGVLCADKFPDIGHADAYMVSLCRLIQKRGSAETILNTCRVGNRLLEAIEWCEAEDLHFTAINDNAPSNIEKYGSNPRKIYADRYIDDKSVGYNRDDVLLFLQHIAEEGKNNE